MATYSWLCDRLRSSAIIWKQLSLRSFAMYDLRSFAIIWKPILSHDKRCDFFRATSCKLNFEHVRMAAICRATNRSEIGGCSHAQFAVAVKSPFDHSSCRATKSLCVNEALRSQISRTQPAYMRSVSLRKTYFGSRICSSRSE